MFLALVTLSMMLWSIGQLSVKPSDNADVDGESTISNISEAFLKGPAASDIFVIIHLLVLLSFLIMPDKQMHVRTDKLPVLGETVDSFVKKI